MAQLPKIIDTKRSYVPVDPNAFPENLLGTQREDSPEESPRIIPYMGENFLPTPYGYKSFFGTNYNINVNSLGSSQAEHVFIFQNLAYDNTLIALCNDGIWAKDAGSTGAWTQLVALSVPAAGVYYEWFFEIIKNKLYCYRGNHTHYHIIETDITTGTKVKITNVAPGFITAANQLGMFRLGGRLGFWDAENAIAWSSADDLSVFTPDVLTGANVTTFTSVTGKISAIRPHGKHAICYSSKGVTLLEVAPGETFLVKATPIIQAGVTYNKQSVVAYPSTVHYCYAASGIYKIESGKAEVVVPEVFDFLKTHTRQPVYLKLLVGRFLAFEVLDEEAINGTPIFSEQTYPASTLTFPGSTSLDGYQDMDPDDINFCDLMRQVNTGATDEQRAAADSQLPDKKPGTFATPVWTCYLSQGNGPTVPVSFGATPCGPVKITNGQNFLHSPTGDGGKLSKWTTDATNKTAKTGAEAYVDGIWTMERFIAYQTAIWEQQEKDYTTFFNEVLAKNEQVVKTTIDTTSCTVDSNPAYTYCTIGEYPRAFSDYKFGYNTCSFWLTRFALDKSTIKNKTRTTTACTGDTNTPLAPDAYYLLNDGNFVSSHASVAAAQAAQSGTWTPVASVNCQGADGTNTRLSSNMYTNALYSVNAHYTAAAGKGTYQTGVGTDGAPPSVAERYPAGHWDKIETQTAQNIEELSGAGVWGADTGFCTITGWTYTKNDGTTATVAASSCTATDSLYPGAPTGTSSRTATSTLEQPTLTDGATGQVCSTAFLAPLFNNTITWNGESLTYPTGDFLLQDGSIAPRWPTIYGFYCYDLHLKKWGKHKGNYKQLLDYFPVNSDSSPVVTTDNQGMLAGVLKEDGFIYLFDDAPTSSYLTWGKIGYQRKGITDIQEVTFNFAQLATGSVQIDISLDGKSVITAATYEVAHSNAKQVTVYPPYSGKWFNLAIKGKFDVTDITIKGLTKGIR